MNYKLARMCDNCPFAEEGAGLQLRLSLAKGRWESIKEDLQTGKHFFCHKTLDGKEEEGGYKNTGNEKICAGSRHYQASLGIVSDAEQIMERLTMMFAKDGKGKSIHQHEGATRHGRTRKAKRTDTDTDTDTGS